MLDLTEIYEGFEIRCRMTGSPPFKATIRRIGSRLFEPGDVDADSAERLIAAAWARIDRIIAESH